MCSLRADEKEHKTGGTESSHRITITQKADQNYLHFIQLHLG